MKHYGDITKLNGAELPPVDIITGGSPCQDLSVAGKRAGLAGERSGLFMEQIRVIKEMRENDRATGRTNDNIRPRYMVWENVPGAFSSNSGKDFHAVLEETAKVAERDACIPEFDGKWPSAGCIMGDGWSIAWRVHDAQFWGVPQRRKRIALVADFGGETAPEILFERKGLSGDITESGKEGKATAGNAAKSIGEAGGAYTLKIRGGADTYIKSDGSIGTAGKGPLVQTELSGTLGVSQDQTLITCLNGWDVQSKHIQPEDGVAESLYAGECRGGGGESYVLQNQEPIVLDTNQNDASIHQDGKTNTLPASAGMGGGYVPMVCLNDQGEQQMDISEDVSGTLRAQEHGHQPIVYGMGHPQNAEQGQGWEPTEVNDTLNAFDSGEMRTPMVVLENHPQDGRVKIKEDGICQTLSGKMGTGGGNVPMVMETYQKTTGSLCASGYDKLGTQEAANDMFVIQSNWDGSQVSPTLTANNANGSQRMPDKDNFNAVISEEVYHCTSENDKVQTLKARDYKDPQCVAYGLDRASFNQGINAQYDFSVDEEKIGTQVAKGPDAVCQSVVRRLTPMECERLQGFPDHWTDIGEWTDSKGKKHKDADSPRYKALGNSIALPFWQWMAKRMVQYLGGTPTMASLFDGIGGFPLVFSRAGCEPVWASEIEEFPIAVTKIRFPEVNER